MRSILVSIITVTLAVSPQNATAYCLFPLFPTYTAGYGGWGAPGWGYGQSYASYGGGHYTAGYGGYGYSNVGSCCQPSPCCDPCSTGSCAGGSCPGGSCAGDAVSSGKPVPDPDLDNDRRELDRREIDRRELDQRDDRDRKSRTFGDDEGYRPRSLRDSEDREDKFEDRQDNFGRSGTGNGDSTDWDKSRKSDEPYSDENSGTDPLRKEPLDEFRRDRFELKRDSFDDFGGESDDLRKSKKPMETDPLKSEDPVDQEVKKPVIEPGASDAPAPAGSESAIDSDQSSSELGNETNVQDFLEPESRKPEASLRRSLLSQTESRSSHFDVRSIRRLAGTTKNRTEGITLISSSRVEERLFRWISLPAPDGQSRL